MQGQDAAQMQQQQEAINRFVDRVEIKKFKILLIPSDIFLPIRFYFGEYLIYPSEINTVVDSELEGQSL